MAANFPLWVSDRHDLGLFLGVCEIFYGYRHDLGLFLGVCEIFYGYIYICIYIYVCYDIYYV